MKSVRQIAKQTGVSVRTLHHYDAIGLLKPSFVAESGYRYYDEMAVERLYLILLFRELEFSLKDIQAILDAPDYDRNRVLSAQIAMLKAKAEHLQECIHLANVIKQTGVNNMTFKEWDSKKIKDYDAQAKALYGKTDAYKEYAQKAEGRSQEQQKSLGDGLMALFARLGEMRELAPESPEVQGWVKQLQGYISEHYYTCTPQILKGLGQMYAEGGSMTENIDAAGGKGTGAFALEAIKVYCR
mgnify:CR=1 FL=1